MSTRLNEPMVSSSSNGLSGHDFSQIFNVQQTAVMFQADIDPCAHK